MVTEFRVIHLATFSETGDVVFWTGYDEITAKRSLVSCLRSIRNDGYAQRVLLLQSRPKGGEWSKVESCSYRKF